MSINYYCIGFDNTNAFFKELENNFKNELTDTKSIVYITDGKIFKTTKNGIILEDTKKEFEKQIK